MYIVFEELYLTDGLESMRSSGSGGIINSGTAMVGGGPMFVTKNGYGKPTDQATKQAIAAAVVHTLSGSSSSSHQHSTVCTSVED